MKNRLAAIMFVGVSLLFFALPAHAQELGADVKKIADGIYVYAGKEQNSNCGIIVTQDGVLMVDSGHTPVESRVISGIVKKLTSLPVRYIVHTEPHADHVVGDFLFSPPAAVISHRGAGEWMRKEFTPERIQKIRAGSPALNEAYQGYRLVTPAIEYYQQMTLNLGERTFQLIYLKDVHSEVDTAVWLPRERVLFATAAVGVKRYAQYRSNVTIPDILASIKTMRALNPEVVIAGHGAPGTIKILDDMERYYTLLLERVGKMAREGKSLDQIKAELKMPEYDDWVGKERFPSNVEAAYKAVKGS